MHVHQIRRLLSAALVTGAAASLAACDVVINSMEGEFGGGRAKAEQAYSKTFKLDGPGATLEIVNANGNITMEAVDGTTIDVKATIGARGATEEAARESLKRVEIKEDSSPGRLRLEARHPSLRKSIEVRFTLRVPRNVKVDLHNLNGTIDITGMQASVRAETTNGSVKARGLGGPVDASTTNGGVDVQMAGLSPDGVRLETTNGGIELRLPAGAKATLSARSVHGGISVSDLPFERDATGSTRRVDGKINGGGAPLRLETVNGGVRVRQVQAGGQESGKQGEKVSPNVDGLGDRHALRGLKGLKTLKGLHGVGG